ncbi:TPA: hypothetical protein ACFOQZ_001282 [Neisseria meningitidis]|jgi:outer membrane lipoprotein-sorting protein
MKKILLIASVAMFASACSQEQAAQTKAKEQAQKRVEAAKQYQSKFSIDKKEKD